MARTVTKKAVPKKKRTVRKKKPVTLSSKINVGKIVYIAVLLFLLAFSVGMVGYVVFFQTVIAGELPFEENDIIFEEPYHSDHDSGLSWDSVRIDKTLPKVTIIIDDMGYHREIEKQLIALDLNLSFSFLPYAPFTPELEEVVYQQGKTILLHLPLEPRSAAWDPGLGALYLKDSRSVHIETVKNNLRMVPHATGVNNHMGSKYTENYSAMIELAEMLKKWEVFFIDSYTTASSKGFKAARDEGVPSARRHVFLDNVQESGAICDQLGKLVKHAEQKGSAIGIGHPYPQTLKAMQSCGADILNGVELVGAGDLVQ